MVYKGSFLKACRQNLRPNNSLCGYQYSCLFLRGTVFIIGELLFKYLFKLPIQKLLPDLICILVQRIKSCGTCPAFYIYAEFIIGMNPELVIEQPFFFNFRLRPVGYGNRYLNRALTVFKRQIIGIYYYGINGQLKQ